MLLVKYRELFHLGDYKALEQKKTVLVKYQANIEQGDLIVFKKNQFEYISLNKDDIISIEEV